MRRVFIAFGIVAFLVYCWASVAYQNDVDVPEYKLVRVDVLGGKTKEQWDADSQAQFQRLMDLESKQYQLPAGTKIPASTAPGKTARHGVTDADGNISANHPLTSDDFMHMISSLGPDDKLVTELRDTTAIRDLAAKNYILRDPVYQPGIGPEGPPLFDYDQVIDKTLIDALLANNIKTITVTGHGTPVNFEFGTSIMIAIIFFTLVAALKPVLWNPFQVMLEKRLRELEMGAEAERQNQTEQTRYEEERKRRHARLNREIQDLRMKGQRKNAEEAGAIVRTARDAEKKAKLAGLKELSDSARDTGGDLRAEVPALAEMVADALTPGHGGPRWDRMEVDEERAQD